MTRNTLNHLIKSAARKRTAMDRAMAEAAKLGKPTNAGIAAGAGLGSILAAAGAIARNGEEDPSLITNPLLLGSLGAAGGYLAGNAFERIPTTEEKDYPKVLSRLGLLGLATGIGIPGTMLADEDIAGRLSHAAKKYKDVTEGKGLAFTTDELGYKMYDSSKKKIKKVKGKYQFPTPEERAEFRSVGREYAKALRESGTNKGYASMLARQFQVAPPPDESAKIGWKVLEKLRFSKYSPYQWAKSLNPMKGGKLLRRLRSLAAKNPVLTGAAGASLLAGGGGLALSKILNKD